MKKLIFALLSIILVSSCTEHDIEYNPSKYVTSKYNAAFVNTFGNPSENQDWGFGSRTFTITRAAQPNGNQWGTTDDNSKYIDWQQPSPITSEELAAVLEVFNQKGKESYEPLIDIENFFVQQVYCGPNGNKMNELATTVDYKVNINVKSWWPYEADTTRTSVAKFDDIINNFNGGNCTAWDGCMLMWNSSTKDFSFKTSQSGGQRWYKHWRMEKINGNYYVGFDHEAVRQADANDNEEDVRDYIYNDWIIKIIPGKGEIIESHNRYMVRIICEDLNATNGSDFDFNDVVFDVSYVDGIDKTFITLQAAGGTIPLFVQGHEVHNEFGTNTNVMVNTNNGTVKKEPVTFEVDGIIDPWSISVAIKPNNTNVLIELKADVGSPAAKIAVDPTFEWCDEREDIRVKYPNFSDYVKNKNTDWY